MTITREQLEKAAKAAGLEFGIINDVPRIKSNDPAQTTCGTYGCPRHCWLPWSPHEDKGQLHDLAMACKIDICPSENRIYFSTEKFDRYTKVNCQDFHALSEAVILAACEQFDAKGGE